MKDVMPGLTAERLRAHAPSAEAAAKMELTHWLERISYAQRCNRHGIYMDALTIPNEIVESVTAELRSRGFFVSQKLEGSVRYNALGSAFVVRWVYVDWRHQAPSDANLERMADEHSGAGDEG
jgi:hypothetical protein